MDLGDNFERAVFISSFNAVLRHLQCLEGTIHSSLLQDRPLVFYGVTVSGIAHLTDSPQYCHSGH
jgi:hypothetical protein